MNFNLRKACPNCPFRVKGGVRLTRGRAEEIASGVLHEGGGALFPCHKTLDYDNDDEEGIPSNTPGTQVCAGSLALALNCGVETQGMQLARRLRFWNGDVDRTGIFKTRAAFLKANRGQ